MSLLDKINKNLTIALKSKNDIEVSAIRMTKAAIKNKEIELRRKLADQEITGVISKQIKQRNDSIQLYKKANRDELAAKEETEIKILEKYLPKQISEEEITIEAEKAIAKLNASGTQDMGKVMAKLMPLFKGKANGSLVSRIVKEKLGK